MVFFYEYSSRGEGNSITYKDQLLKYLIEALNYFIGRIHFGRTKRLSLKWVRRKVCNKYGFLGWRYLESVRIKACCRLRVIGDFR